MLEASLWGLLIGMGLLLKLFPWLLLDLKNKPRHSDKVSNHAIYTLLPEELILGWIEWLLFVIGTTKSWSEKNPLTVFSKIKEVNIFTKIKSINNVTPVCEYNHIIIRSPEL